MYKCIENVGKYVPGDIVPDEMAETYIKMYKKSPVKLINSEIKSELKSFIVESKEIKPEIKESNILDLNNDGIVDKKDAKIASKVFNFVKKRNKKNKR